MHCENWIGLYTGLGHKIAHFSQHKIKMLNSISSSISDWHLAWTFSWSHLETSPRLSKKQLAGLDSLWQQLPITCYDLWTGDVLSVEVILEWRNGPRWRRRSQRALGQVVLYNIGLYLVRPTSHYSEGGSKVKVASHKTLPAWVFAFLRVLASSSLSLWYAAACVASACTALSVVIRTIPMGHCQQSISREFAYS